MGSKQSKNEKEIGEFCYQLACLSIKQNDEIKAVEYWTQGAANNHPICQNNLGVCYQNGKHGLQKNTEKAFHYFFLSAKQNYLDAIFSLAGLLWHGDGCVKDQKKAFELYCLIDQHKKDHQDVIFNLGICYYNGKGCEQSYEKAIEYLSKSTKNEAKYLLAVCYRNGYGCQKDEKKSFDYFYESAQQGFPDSEYELGLCYENEIGTEKNLEKAIEYLQKAASHFQKESKMKYLMALKSLGGCFLSVHNSQKAVECFEISAIEGYAKSQFLMARIYQFGVFGKSQNNAIAKVWYKKSFENEPGLGDPYDYALLLLEDQNEDEKPMEWFQKSFYLFQNFDAGNELIKIFMNSNSKRIEDAIELCLEMNNKEKAKELISSNPSFCFDLTFQGRKNALKAINHALFKVSVLVEIIFRYISFS